MDIQPIQKILSKKVLSIATHLITIVNLKKNEIFIYNSHSNGFHIHSL